MLSLIAMCLVAIQYLVVGYSFAFGEINMNAPSARKANTSTLGAGTPGFGSFIYAGSLGVGDAPNDAYGSNIPQS